MKVMEAIGKGFVLTGKSMGLLVVVFLFNAAWNIITLPFLGTTSPTTKVDPTVVALSIIFIFLNIFIQGGTLGLLKDAIASNGKVSVSNFAKYGAKFYLRFLGMGGVILIGAALAALVLFLIFSISLVIKNVIIGIVAISVVIILLAIGLYYLFLLFIAPYALVFNDCGIFKAMKNSFHFMRAHLWKVAGLSTLLVLISLGIGVIFGIMIGFLSLGLKGMVFQGVAGVGSGAVNAYISVLVSAAIMIYYCAFSGSNKKATEEFSA